MLQSLNGTFYLPECLDVQHKPVRIRAGLWGARATRPSRRIPALRTARHGRLAETKSEFDHGSFQEIVA